MGSNGRQFVIVMKMMLIASAAVAEAQPNSDCPSSCGNLSIPYPFGTKPDCYMDDKFFINCSDSSSPPQAFLQSSTISVLDIYLDGQLRINNWVSSDCYDSSGKSYYTFDTWLRSGLYNISYTRNKFTVTGCDTLATIEGSIGQRYGGACVSLCNEITDAINGSCNGIGCCKADIPSGVRDYTITLGSLNNHSDVLSFNPCSYAFVVEDGGYNFSISDLVSTNIVTRKYPMILDWTISDQSCSEAEKNLTSFACQGNSSCYEPEYGKGYLCKCLDGYQGNPYLSNSCKDMNECELFNPCNISTSKCHNMEGSYYCSCLEGYEGNDRKNGTDCKPKVDSGRSREVQIAIGISVGFFALFLCISCSFLVFKQRKIAKLREKYFKQNGGILLRDQFSKRDGYPESIQIFSADELEKATSNYHESKILGQGGQGTVYKGILAHNRMVAIKKSRIGDQSQVEPFINEISVLFQINHRNVVKLLGCCLETPVPLLVYEYVTNGSLFDHMHHNVAAASFLPWETRLRIATETAEALSYLHSSASIPIFHRDIKLANILLDEHYTAKVSDFGASRLIPSDQDQVTTIVQGTFGYLDPEYMQTGQLTDKSDVYSFGVVLIELLTGQKAVCFERSEEKKVLAMYFVSLMKEERLLEILDARMLNDGIMGQLKEVAALAWRCVRLKGEERPTMKEVAHELAGLQAMSRHPWVKSNSNEEEAEYLLLCSPYADGASNSSSMVYDSITNQVAFELDGAR